MGLTNRIIKNMAGSVFHNLPSGGEGKNIEVQLTIGNLTQLYQVAEKKINISSRKTKPS